MKTCPYCGKENADDAKVCYIDGHVLTELPPGMYCLRVPWGREYGPISGDVVREWLAEGLVNSQAEVRQGGSGWKPITEFPEFKDALALHQWPTTSTPASIGLPHRQQKRGLAVASLILGIVSFFGLSIFTAIPAIITGHMARHRYRKSPAFGGGAMALTGTMLGYVAVLLTILLVRARLQAHAHTHSVRCMNQAREISRALASWASDHGQRFPADFVVIRGEIARLSLFVCPCDSSKVPAKTWSAFGTQNVTYLYFPRGQPNAYAAAEPTVMCPLHRHTAYLDGEFNYGKTQGRWWLLKHY